MICLLLIKKTKTGVEIRLEFIHFLKNLYVNITFRNLMNFYIAMFPPSGYTSRVFTQSSSKTCTTMLPVMVIRLSVPLLDHGARHPRIWEEVQGIRRRAGGRDPTVRAARGGHGCHHGVGSLQLSGGRAQAVPHHPGCHQERRSGGLPSFYEGESGEEEGSEKEGENWNVSCSCITNAHAEVNFYCLSISLTPLVVTDLSGWPGASRSRGNAERNGAWWGWGEPCHDAKGIASLRASIYKKCDGFCLVGLTLISFTFLQKNQQSRERNFNSLMSDLEAKYSQKGTKPQKGKKAKK